MAERSTLRAGAKSAVLLRNFDQIIDGATLALAENPAASMREVAEHSGVVRATLYRHFSSREELLREIFRSAGESTQAAIKAAEPQRGPATEALRRQIEALLEVAGRYRIIAEQRLAFADLEGEVAQAMTPLVELIERGQSEGSIRADLSARWLARTLPTLCTAAPASLAEGDFEPAEAVDVILKTFFESLDPR